MRSLRAAARLALGFAVLAGLLAAAPAPDAAASAADAAEKGCAFAAGLGNGECQHFLRNPAGATEDPCWCDKCRNGITGQRHDGHTIPPGWNADLFDRGGMECYLKRHSVAWGITCSECYWNDKPWPDGSGSLLGTVPPKDFAGRHAKQTIERRLAAEKKNFRHPDEVMLAYNQHFYCVTDIRGLKVRMPSGSSRVMSQHEWMHLMIERAEFARREWVRNLGEPMLAKGDSLRPIAMFFVEKERDYDRVGEDHFRQAGAKGRRGAGAELCEKMCLTGLAACRELAGEDRELQVWMRHTLSHNLLLMWGSLQTRAKSSPVWMEEGLAHWLTKSIEPLHDEATYCIGEGGGGAAAGAGGGARGGGGGSGAPEWSGKDWEKDVGKIASKAGAIEELLGKTVPRELTQDDHKRLWSYMELGLSEWRAPFAKMLAAVRQEKDLREAFMSNLGCTPEVFDERWRERVTGKRKTLAPSANEGEPEANDTPGARDRRSIRSEADPKILAAKIRALGELKDVKTIPVVVDVMAQNRDLPRETALVTLLRTKDPACIEALWNYGLSHADGIVRAYTARICGRLNATAAVPKLESMLTDGNWYARAEAAVALGILKDAKAMPGLRKMASSDGAEKAQVGAIDALSMFGSDAVNAVPVIAKQLDSSQWQIRVAACQALGSIGAMEGVEPLVGRMEKETGRVADEIYEALKKITRDDLGRKPENWRTWWDREKKNAQGGMPKRPEEKKPEEKPKNPAAKDPRSTTDGGPPPYFGVEIYSSRVAFICDTSDSMTTLFTPDPSAAKALSREYVGRDKLTICKEEIAQALTGLDPRAHFNVVTFGTQIRSFERNPVAATKANIESAIGFLKSIPGEGETNYYDSLKAALDIGDEPDTNGNFRATPDTITFLTDGQPTRGDIVDADVILEWYTGLNRYARVKTHTITFGLMNVDMPLLRGMAERNGGKFTIVPEVRRQKR
jgi:hypothetical protein